MLFTKTIRSVSLKITGLYKFISLSFFLLFVSTIVFAIDAPRLDFFARKINVLKDQLILHSNSFNNCTSVIASVDIPKTISATVASTVTSQLPISDNGIITDVNLINLDISHDYLDDVIVTLSSPNGTDVRLINRPCGSARNIALSLDDAAASATLPCPPTNGQTYRPDRPLSAFIGESITGTWTLSVQDVYGPLDGGSLNGWSLELTYTCAATEICDNNIDDDGDGLIDCADGDCPTSCTSLSCNDGVVIMAKETASASGSGNSGIPSISNFYVPSGNNRVIFVIANFEREHCQSGDNCTNSNTSGTGLGDNFASPNFLSGNPQLSVRFAGTATIDQTNPLTFPDGDLRFMYQTAFPDPPDVNSASFYSRESYFIALYESDINTVLGGSAAGNINLSLPDVNTPLDNADEAILLAYVFANVKQDVSGIVRSGVNTGENYSNSQSGGISGNFSITDSDLDNGQEPDEAGDGVLVVGFNGKENTGFNTISGFNEIDEVSVSNTNGTYSIFNEPDGFTVSTQFRNGPSTGIIDNLTIQSSGSASPLSNGGMLTVFTLDACSNTAEVCNNGIDDDGDGAIDSDDPDCFVCSEGLLNNPGFESDMTGWISKNNSTVLQEVGGNKYLHISGGAGGIGQDVATTPGTVYSISMYGKKNATEGAWIGLTFFDSGFNIIGANHAAEITSTDYKRYYVAAAAPANAAWVQAFAWKNAGAGTADVDGFCLEEWPITYPTCMGDSCTISADFNNYVYSIDDSNADLNWLDYDNGGLFLCDNGDGTLGLKGVIIGGRDATWNPEIGTNCGVQDGWLVDFTLSDMQTWAEFQGNYEVETNLCPNAYQNLDYWALSGTLTGIGCNTGRTITDNQASMGYRLQIGRGGNQHSCEFGLSTWIAGTENGNPVLSDIYAHLDSACYYSMRPVTCDNILTNGELNNGTTDWNLYTQSDNVANLSIDNSSQLSGTNSALVNISSVTGTDWHVQFVQTGKSIIAGKNYNISFEAKAAADRTVSVMIQRQGPPYTVYWWREIQLSTITSTYSFDFTVDSTNVDNTGFYINLGETTQNVWIDNLAFQEVCNPKTTCGTIQINNVNVSDCINHPLMDVATLDVEVSWTGAPYNDSILVEIANQTEIIEVPNGVSSPHIVQFMIPADGSSNNAINISWKNTSGCEVNTTYNAPSACSNEQIACDILYICGDDKPYDGDAWDHGWLEYLDALNGTSILTPAFSKNDANGIGLYDPMNTNNALAINFSDYDLIIVSATTEGRLSSDLIDSLAITPVSVLNSNIEIYNDLGMTASEAGVAWQSEAYIDNTTAVDIYNFNNKISPWNGRVLLTGDYHNTADVYLWEGAGDQAAGIEGVLFNYTADDVLPTIASHGNRVFLGYHMNGFYANDVNGGSVPTPSSAWFEPAKHLTLEGKNFLDSALVLATATCAQEETPDNDQGTCTGSDSFYTYLLPNGAMTATYRTISDGNWNDIATWQNGNIPPLEDINNQIISIEHKINVQNNNIKLLGGTQLYVTNGQLIFNFGNFIIENGSAYFLNSDLKTTNGGNVQLTTAQSNLIAKNSFFYIEHNFQNSGGILKLEDICLVVYEVFDNTNGIDSLINVYGIIGVGTSGNFTNYAGSTMYVENSSFELPNGNFDNQSAATLTGDSIKLWLRNGNLQNSGSWTLPVTKYCVSGQVTIPMAYLPSIEACTNIEDDFVPQSCSCITSESDYCYLISDGDGDGYLVPDTFYTFNHTNGVVSAIGPTGTMNIEAMALDTVNYIIYAADGNDFGTINIATGIFTAINTNMGSLNGAEGNNTIQDIDGMTYDYTNNIIWATERATGVDGLPDDILLKIDPTTGIPLANGFGLGVGYLTINTNENDLDDIALATDGTLYAISNLGSSGNQRLGIINKTTGAWTELGDYGIEDVESLTFSAEGQLLATTGEDGDHQNRLYSIDATTAEASYVGSILPAQDVEACACNFGNFIDLHIGDKVWADLDFDGLQDIEEPGLEGVKVNLLNENGTPYLDASNNPVTTTTNLYGIYDFGGLSPGNYLVEFELPTGTSFANKDVGGDDTKDSDADAVTGRTGVITLAGSSNDRDADAGILNANVVVRDCDDVGELFVVDESGGDILRFNPTTGALIDTFITGLTRPKEMIVGPDNYLYVSDAVLHEVRRYSLITGAFIDILAKNLRAPNGMTFGANGMLYVNNKSKDEVIQIAPSTGATSVFVAEQSGGLDSNNGGLEFGPDGNLYVASRTTDEVLRFNGTTGAFIDVFVSAASGGLNGPDDIAFGADGNLYVVSSYSDQVKRYNGTTGAYIDDFVTYRSGGLRAPRGISFATDGNIYVSGQTSPDGIYRYNESTGAFVDLFATGLEDPRGMLFAPVPNCDDCCSQVNYNNNSLENGNFSSFTSGSNPNGTATLTTFGGSDAVDWNPSGGFGTNGSPITDFGANPGYWVDASTNGGAGALDGNRFYWLEPRTTVSGSDCIGAIAGSDLLGAFCQGDTVEICGYVAAYDPNNINSGAVNTNFVFEIYSNNGNDPADFLSTPTGTTAINDNGGNNESFTLPLPASTSIVDITGNPFTGAAGQVANWRTLNWQSICFQVILKEEQSSYSSIVFSMADGSDGMAVDNLSIRDITTPDAGRDTTLYTCSGTIDLNDAQSGESWVKISEPSGVTASIDANTGVVTGLTHDGIYKFLLAKTANSFCHDTIRVLVNCVEEICGNNVDDNGDGLIDEYCVEDCQYRFDRRNILENSEGNWSLAGTHNIAGNTYQYDVISTGHFYGNLIGGDLFAWEASTNLFWYNDPSNNSGNPAGDYFLGTDANICLVDTSSVLGLCGFNVCVSTAAERNHWILVEAITNFANQGDRIELGREYRAVSGETLWNWEETCITIDPSLIPGNMKALIISIAPTGSTADRVYFDKIEISPIASPSCEVDPCDTEICDNNIDDDGDGLTDCEDPDCQIATITNLSFSNCTLVGNDFQSTLSVEVAWSNPPTGENIIVSANNTTQTIDILGGATSPTTIQFTITADNSQDNPIAINYSGGGGCTFNSTYNAPAPCPNPTDRDAPCDNSSGHVGGIVFEDLNGDGQQDTGEPGLAGILVTATDSTGATVGQTTTNNLGVFQFETLTNGIKVRLEFTAIPSGMYPTNAETFKGTTVQFEQVPSCDAVLGLIDPTENPCDVIIDGSLVNGYSLVSTLPGADDITLAVKDITQLGTLWQTAGNRNTNQAASVNTFRTWTTADFEGSAIFSMTIDPKSETIYAITSPLHASAANTETVLFETAIAPKVFRIDPATGGVTRIAQLPGTLGLGYIDFDAVHEQLFITNIDDGRIYRLNTDGVILSSFDPLSADDGIIDQLPTLGDRILGVAFNPINKRVYYSVWSNHYDRTNVSINVNATSNTIRSVALDASGAFIPASDQLEITMPYGTSGFNLTTPVGDIAFNQAGNSVLLAEFPLGENTSTNQIVTTAYIGVLREYQLSAGIWNLEPSFGGNDEGKYDLGNQTFYKGRNSRGGVDWAYESISGNAINGNDAYIVATGDALHINAVEGDNIFGLQFMPSTGGNISNSILVDIDNNIANENLYVYGDIDVFKDYCANLSLEIGNYVWLDGDEDGVQDPNEFGMQGVNVSLYNSMGDSLTTVVTNADGAYYFNDVTHGLLPNTTYYLVVGKGGQFDTSLGVLNQVNNLTIANSGTGNYADWNDSDGAIATTGNGQPVTIADYPFIEVQTGIMGQNEHHFDFGFRQICSAAIVVNDSLVLCPGTTYEGSVAANDLNHADKNFTVIAEPANGNVTMNLDGTFVYNSTTSSCETDEFTYQVCDVTNICCVNAIVHLNFNDTTIPSLTNIPDNDTVSCDELIPLPPQIFAIDNCPRIALDVQEESTQGEDGCSLYDYTITRTWTAIDQCGNSTSATQIVEVEDVVAPDIYRIYTMPNGKKMIAGVMELVGENWKTVNLPIDFSTEPIIFHQVITSDAIPVVSQIQNISVSQFQLRIKAEEAHSAKLTRKSVAWIALETGAQTTDYQLEVNTTLLSELPQGINFQNAFTATPALFMSSQTTEEIDPFTVRHSGLTTTGATLNLQEEASDDVELTHTDENIGYLAIEKLGSIRETKGRLIGEVGSVNINSNWTTINLNHTYHNPVIIANSLSNIDGEAGTVSIRNVGLDQFEIKVSEWSYLDGIHNNESVSYIVIEGSIPLESPDYCDTGTDSLDISIDFKSVDNCDVSVVINYVEKDTFIGATKVITRTWSAEDECGNSTSYSQEISCEGVSLRLISILQGAMLDNAGDGLMRDDLRKKGLLPMEEPYAAINRFQHVAGGGGEKITDISILADNGANSIVDWVFVELRDAGDVNNVIATKSALIQRDGDVVTTRGDTLLHFTNTRIGDYFVAIRHRNHLGIISLDTYTFSPSEVPFVDFTFNFTPVVGDHSSVEMDDLESLWSGDLNSDGKVIYQGPNNDIFFMFLHVLRNEDNQDFLPNFISRGYTNDDFNLDGSVIYQGPSNDRARLLFNTILSHPDNSNKLSNFIIYTSDGN